MAPKVKVHVVYCGAWGYKPKFQKIKKELEQVFGDAVYVTGEGTTYSTGWLEVQVVGGKLLHSKKNGDGYVDSTQKMQRIIKGVEEAISHASWASNLQDDLLVSSHLRQLWEWQGGLKASGGGLLWWKPSVSSMDDIYKTSCRDVCYAKLPQTYLITLKGCSHLFNCA